MTARRFHSASLILRWLGFSSGALLLAVFYMAPAGPAYAQGAATPADSATAVSKPASRRPSYSESRSHAKAESADQPDSSPFGSFENSRNRGPVNIQSQSLTMNYKDNTVLFRGDVHATQADGQLTSNTLNVKYDKDFHEVQEMVADGNVRISQGLRWCTSDHGVMNQGLHTVVLTGDPVCHDANDQISGSKITVHLDTGKSEVEGGVKAVIFPRDSKTRDNKAAPESNQQPAS